MAPDNKVNTVVEHALRHGLLRPVRYSVVFRSIKLVNERHCLTCLPILMQKQDVEPIRLVLRHVHFDSVTSQFEVHPCIFYISNTV